MQLRRPLYVIVFVLTALVAATPAAADKPLRIPSEPLDMTFAAGELCPFEMRWADETNRGKTTVFFDKEGSPRFLLGSGQIFSTVTNLETGESLTFNISGPGRITLNEDGSQTVVGTGPWLIGFFPTDEPAGPMMLFTHGRFTLEVSPGGALDLVEPPPRSVDICTLLAA
jgi:hypothetical protein